MSQQEEERNTTSPPPDLGSDTSQPTFLKATRLQTHREASDKEDYSSPLREDVSQLTSLSKSKFPLPQKRKCTRRLKHLRPPTPAHHIIVDTPRKDPLIYKANPSSIKNQATEEKVESFFRTNNDTHHSKETLFPETIDSSEDVKGTECFLRKVLS